jgi:tRNA(fMet)-specific endonuclease VapC
MALTHLLDTDICIHAMKSRDLTLSRRLDELRGNCAVSDVSIYELYSGAERYDFPDKRKSIIDTFIGRLTVLPFDTRAARIAAPFNFQLESKGQKIGGFDMLIAATALAHNLTLFTNNSREFKRVPGLSLESFQRQP